MPRGDPRPFPSSVGYPYDWPGRPRRMARAEVDLWQWFIERYPDRYDTVWFDTMIPSDPLLEQPSPECPSDVSAKWAWCWHCLTCLRADVLGQFDGFHQIIEIRSNPRLHTFLQAVHITSLYVHRYPNLTWRSPMVICDALPLHIKMVDGLEVITLIQRAGYEH